MAARMSTKQSKYNLYDRRSTIKHTSRANLGDGFGEDFEAWLRTKQQIKPDDQLELTEAELAEDVIKVLDTDNSSPAKNLVIFSFKDSAYVPLPPPPSIVTLLSVEGTALHVESEEAQAQILEHGMEIPTELNENEAVETDAAAKETSADNIAAAGSEDGDAGDGEGDDAPDADDDDAAQAAPSSPPPSGRPAEAVNPKKKLINQFNFCERAALTFTNPSRSIDTQTIPPPRSTYGANVLQWVIYDSYTKDFEQQERERDKDKKHAAGPAPAGLPVKKDTEKTKQSDKNAANEELNKKYLQCWQILERMINQNIYDDIAQDYRYYEDPSDEFRDEEGTLLPLWKFMYEKTKKMNVTDMCFNTLYYDLFAVCFGSFDFMKQSPEGSICLFTIKNPSFPDFIITTESGVMCCDVHPKYPYLLVIGMFDGNVAVYNLQKKGVSEPIYKSRGIHGKHSDVVWEVKWGPDMPDGEINFYSISADGRVCNWVLMQSKLTTTTIITLFLDREFVGGPDGTDIKLKGCGTCMIFHPKLPNIFLVGTEEGLIFKCSTEFSSRYLMTYQAHYLPVYRIDFNKYNSNIFVSCGADWRIKIWEDMRSEPLFIFDLGASVGDVKWAPYSSTVLAAVTTDGKVFVFDINVNKYKPICTQQVVPRKNVRLTRIAFNQKIPFIIVGDDKGTVTSLKLSPNLRLKAKPPKKQMVIEQSVLQVQKLDKLLSLVRELPEETLAIDKDGASSVSDS